MSTKLTYKTYQKLIINVANHWKMIFYIKKMIFPKRFNKSKIITGVLCLSLSLEYKN